MTPLWYLMTGGTLLTAGDIVLKEWLTQRLPYASALYGIGLALYVIALICLVESFRGMHIAAASVLLVVVNVVTLALASRFYFGESLTMSQIAGIILALCAIALIELGSRTP